MVKDIRNSLPRTPQTDPNKFPDYEYRPYPRMMTREEGKKKVPYTDDAGNPVIVQSEAEEKAFLAANGKEVEEAPLPTGVAVPMEDDAPLTPLKVAQPSAAKPKVKLPADLKA